MEPHWETYFKNALRWWGGRNVFFFFFFFFLSCPRIKPTWSLKHRRIERWIPPPIDHMLFPETMTITGNSSCRSHFFRCSPRKDLQLLRNFQEPNCTSPSFFLFFLSMYVKSSFPSSTSPFWGIDPISRYTPNHEFLVMHPMKNNQSIQLSVLSSRWCLVFTMSFILSHPLPPH